MKVRKSVGLIFALVLAASACGDELVLTQAVEVPVTAETAAAIVDVKVPFSDGGFFAPQFSGSSFELTFNSATSFTATGGGVTIVGTVTYGSCTFTWTSPAPGGSKKFDTCGIKVASGGTANNVTVSLGVAGSAPVTSQPVTSTVEVKEESPNVCRVYINGVASGSTYPCTTSS